LLIYRLLNISVSAAEDNWCQIGSGYGSAE